MDSLDETLRDNPVWQELRRQEARDPRRIDLAAIWRAGGRKRPWSPRWWRQSYHRTAEVTLEGTRPDDPAWTDAGTAIFYVMHMDKEIMTALNEAFFCALREDSAGMLMRATTEAGRKYLAFFACGSTASGDKTREDAARDIIAEVARRTEPLGPYAQETKVAEVQRAFLATLYGPNARGEYLQDR
jgi:hypothetical protein